MTSLRCAVLATLVSIAGFAGAQNPKFVKIHEGAHWTWYARSDQFQAHEADIRAQYDYADHAFEALEDAWGLKPKESRYNLLVMDHPGGGFAAGDISEVHGLTGKNSPGIGCSYDAFYNVAHGVKAYWAPVLITHEMVNLFTGAIVSGGWPTDWWADDRSPFPYMTSVEIEFRLVPQIGVYHLAESNDPQIKMFRRMKDQYGWEMFKRAFQMAIEDGIDWSRVGGDPSAQLTNYVAAYLEMGARADLSKLMTGPVPNYNHAKVLAIIDAHRRWKAHARESNDYGKALVAFLSGRYADVR